VPERNHDLTDVPTEALIEELAHRGHDVGWLDGKTVVPTRDVMALVSSLGGIGNGALVDAVDAYRASGEENAALRRDLIAARLEIAALCNVILQDVSAALIDDGEAT
jgi:hypothetical protein